MLSGRWTKSVVCRIGTRAESPSAQTFAAPGTSRKPSTNHGGRPKNLKPTGVKPDQNFSPILSALIQYGPGAFTIECSGLTELYPCRGATFFLSPRHATRKRASPGIAKAVSSHRTLNGSIECSGLTELYPLSRSDLLPVAQQSRQNSGAAGDRIKQRDGPCQSLRSNRQAIERATQSITAAILAGDQKRDLRPAAPSEIDGTTTKSAADETVRKPFIQRKKAGKPASRCEKRVLPQGLEPWT
jgi:hypothetical protein